ncbi:MAG: hypothetical protein Kow0090_22290 [Myxococcota bacterium]
MKGLSTKGLLFLISFSTVVFFFACGEETQTVTPQDRGGGLGEEEGERTCIADSECLSGEVCDGGICSPPTGNDDDDDDDDNDDVQDDDDTIPLDDDDDNDSASGCKNDIDCSLTPLSPICDLRSGNCVQCIVDRDCVYPLKCVDYVCSSGSSDVGENGCQNDPDCSGTPVTPFCDIMSGDCVQCLKDGHCIYPQTCSGGKCVSGGGGGNVEEGGECEDVTDCEYGYDCNLETNLCVVAPACQTTSECESRLVCGFISEPTATEPPWVGCGSSNASGAPFGSACHSHLDCYEWNCMYSYCTKLCRTDADCGSGFKCDKIKLQFGDNPTVYEYPFCVKSDDGGGTGGGQVYDGVCDAGQTCCPIQGGSVCLLADCASIPATAEFCDAQSKCLQGAAVSATDASGNDECICLEECSTGGGTVEKGCEQGESCCSIEGVNLCLMPDCESIPESAVECLPDNTCAEGVAVSAIDQYRGELCICLKECADGSGAAQLCGSGEVCNGDAVEGYDVCLTSEGGAPSGVGLCNNSTKEGCKIGEIWVDAVTQSGTRQCICLKNCGAGSGYYGDSACGSYTCEPAQQVQAYVCLVDGRVPNDVGYCDDNTGEGCNHGEFPALVRDAQGNIKCRCLVGC